MSASALLLSPQGRLRSGWRAALFVVLVAVLSPLAQIVVSLPGALATRGEPVAPPALVTWAGVVAGALLAHWVMLRFVDRASWGYAGLARHEASGGRIGAGFALGTLAVAVPCALLLAAGWLRVVREPTTSAALGGETLRLLAMLVPAALAEELLMRGYLLSALSDGMGRIAALLATSIVFALLHMNNPGMSPGALVVVGLAGIFLGAVRFATASLYAAWAAHLAWNAVLALVLHALVSGASLAGAGWRTVDAGPDWATGGTWGPEGGAPAALGLIAATGWLIARRPGWLGASLFRTTRGAAPAGEPLHQRERA